MMDFPGHFQHIFQQLNQQRLHAQLCDVVVEVGGERFQAHRSILAASSSHFRALLGSGDEAGVAEQGGAAAVMALDPEVVTPEAFSTLLDMIYTSTLSLGASNVMDVLLAASHLHLNAVVKACKLHLSRKNFPASPPKGWRSLRQHPTSHAPSAAEEGEEGPDEEGAVVEVSQSGGREGEEARWARLGEQSAAQSSTRKRKCEETGFGSNRKRGGGSRGQEEVEEKYGATKGEAEEIQLPSQSDGGGGAWEKDADTVLKVKVGDEGEDDGEEPKMVEVKRENLSSGSPEPASPLPDPARDSPFIGEKAAVEAASSESVASSLSQLCAEAADVGGDSIDGLESLSELAFSCFLAPSNEIGALEDGEEEEDSLASLTAAAAAAAAAASEAPMSAADQPSTSSDASSSSSLVYPLTSVPVQPLLAPPPPAFSDALILQAAQSPLSGFLRPGVGLENLLPQPGKSRGRKALRRIAPKAAPGSEAEPSAAGDAEAPPPPPLTRASEDVLSKCKKAAAEDLVLLVEGERKYACKICCKTFMNLTDCRKHIRVHTGEKPYPCPKCGKRFSQSSHLYKHSKNSTCLGWRDEHSFPSDALTPP